MMSTWGRVSKRFKLLVFAGVLMGLMMVPAAANATITQVFGSVSCATQTGASTLGQRWCGTSAGTTVPSFDGTPIDVAMAFPAESGPDNNYPVVGIYHGWGGSKVTPSSSAVQNWVKQGFAVFSISDRGWGSSCGTPSKPANTIKASPCERGWIHLMSRKYEVRDVQTLLGKLADEGLINPQQIGATGGSYGGGMSLQLGSLKDRVELLNGELVPWESAGGKPMKIAATAPEYPWTDLATALQPNGSSKDYVANDPYKGVNDEYRFGIEKNNWNGSLYLAGQLIGYFGPNNFENESNITEWHNFNIKGGPYDGEPLAIQQAEYLPFHSPYYTPLNEAPAPSIMENGWNDDLFPVDETVRYYNKVRSTYPSQPMKLFYLDLGHNPRSASTPSTSDVTKLFNAQAKWFKYFIKGEGAEPSEAQGGVTAITSFCPQTAGGSGTEFDAPNWASLAPGEIHVNSAAEQTIASPATAPANAFTSGTICTTSAAADNASAAEYRVPAAPTGGYTLVGSSTVIAEFSTPAANDQVIARLYDENVSAKTEQLIGRAMLRPLNPGGGFTQQAFQLHPQAWNVAAGHVVKLELLTADSTYARNSSSPHSVQVKNLELRVPTADAPGSAEGLVQAPLVKYLPSGYTLALNQVPGAPGAPALTSGSNPNANGQFTLAWAASQAATSPTYTLQHQNALGGWTTVASGITGTEYTFGSGNPEAEGTWTYRVTESNASSPSEPSPASEEVKVDKSAPNPPTASADRAPDYAGGGGWYKDSVTVSFSSNGDPLLSDGSIGSGVNEATLSSPQTFNSDGSHTASGTVADNVGNVSAPGTLTVQVDASAPSVEVNCPSSTPVGSSASASVVASDGQSGLASDPSGTVPIDTSEEGPQTTEATATDNVGHSTTSSCTTQVVETRVITGKVKGKLVVKEGEAVKLTSTAQANAIEVQSGGSLDVEGATTKGIKANKAAVLRICGAHVGAIKAVGGTGAVTIGDGEGCAGNTGSAGATLTGNTDGVSVVGNSFKGSVKVSGNSGGVTVTGNTIAKNLTVSGNSGTVVDQPNTVGGKTKAQARKLR
jgi:dienelactone hydrolase